MSGVDFLSLALVSKAAKAAGMLVPTHPVQYRKLRVLAPALVIRLVTHVGTLEDRSGEQCPLGHASFFIHDAFSL